MEGEIKIEKRGPEDYLVVVRDYETGSTTSMGAESELEGINSALRWLGMDLTVYTSTGSVGS